MYKCTDEHRWFAMAPSPKHHWQRVRRQWFGMDTAQSSGEWRGVAWLIKDARVPLPSPFTGIHDRVLAPCPTAAAAAAVAIQKRGL
jgi:hypothetical protein